MTAMLKVQKGVPLPSINHAPKNVQRKYPIDTMAVGEMFFLPARNTRSVSSYISRISKGVPGKFSARHCWMLPLPDDDWEECEEGVDGAVEGTGVWRLE